MAKSKKQNTEFMDCSELDLAYLAGIFDGEGCMMIKGDHNNMNLRPQIGIEMAHYQSISFINDKFPCSKILTLIRKNKKHSTTFRWQISGIASIIFIKTILPFLKAKKEEAILFIEFPYYEGKPLSGKKYPVELLEKRLSIKKEITSLKTKGKGLITPNTINAIENRIAHYNNLKAII